MDIMEAIASRHSVRVYKEEKIGSEIREKLDALVRQVNEESGLDITIEYDNPEGFDSKLAHYGNFRNVGNFIILKGKDVPDFEERCGYYGEKIVLKAQMLGLNSCWAALTFNKKMVKQLVPSGERFAMVIALGYGETSGTPRKSKDMSEVVATKGNMPEWFEKGAKAALLAPTAVNQQKFKMGLVGGEPVIKVDGVGFYTKTDLGIAKYHFEVASGRKVR